MNYYISEYKGKIGGSILVQKAALKKNGFPILLALCGANESAKTKNMIKDMGAWFQNTFVSGFLAIKETEEEISGALEELTFSEVFEVFKKTAKEEDASFILAAGDFCYAFGERVYAILNEFGRLKSVPVCKTRDNIPGNNTSGDKTCLLRIADSLSLIITDKSTELLEDADVLSCINGCKNEEELTRGVREISVVRPEWSFICIRISGE